MFFWSSDPLPGGFFRPRLQTPQCQRVTAQGQEVAIQPVKMVGDWHSNLTLQNTCEIYALIDHGDSTDEGLGFQLISTATGSFASKQEAFCLPKIHRRGAVVDIEAEWREWDARHQAWVPGEIQVLLVPFMGERMIVPRISETRIFLATNCWIVQQWMARNWTFNPWWSFTLQ